MKTCNSDLAKRAILYTDTIDGKQTLRDDLWAVTTDELNEVERKISKAFADGVLAGQRQCIKAFDMVQSALSPAEGLRVRSSK